MKSESQACASVFQSLQLQRQKLSPWKQHILNFLVESIVKKGTSEMNVNNICI